MACSSLGLTRCWFNARRSLRRLMVLLGYDVLAKGVVGLADILLSRGVILLDGHKLPCISQAQCENLRKVTVADDTMVPGISEAVVDVFLERTEWDDHLGPDFIVEPTGAFQQRYSLIIAAAMVADLWPRQVFGHISASFRPHLERFVDFRALHQLAPR
ncbi:hypothetical protein DPMN_032917 [Dreissena polymorpha]|uniref:Uncharacterized protein n=1 Tax=Dreissena polymorpha TaxID=45954 RepID=A0A9D4M520_DREPO|nr:hypothetical protein DPMN_032917 [Dreissena polymorpha]